MNKLPEIDYKAIFNNVPGLYLILLPDLTIIEVSEAYAKATMTKRGEIIGKNLFEIFPDNPDDASADGEANLRSSLQFVLKNKTSHTMAFQKYDIRKPDGEFEVRYWSPINRPVLNPDGEVKYIIHRAEDVSDFVKMENENEQKDIHSHELEARVKEMRIESIKRAKEIQNLNNHLDSKVIERTEHLNKANETIQKNLTTLTVQKKQLEDFCNIISHNLRAPLVNISMLIEMLSENPNKAEKTLLLDKLSSTSKNLSDIFNELVESIQVHQDSEIPSEKLSLEACTQKVVEGLQAEIDKSGAIIKTRFKSAPFVYYPSNYFKSILLNLVSNSLKYQSPKRKPAISITSEKKGNSIILSVTDNGLGIDLIKHKDSLFKIRKVFHSHPDAKGFGLFITKSQVDAMGGKIWIESTPDKGSTFFVEFINQGV